MRMKCGFTLMEVNLAVFIMAAGVLAMVALYPLGFRENQQSRDDVAAAALADTALAPLVGALSSSNITWQAWCDVLNADYNNENSSKGSAFPSGGWSSYCRDTTYFLPVSKNQMQAKTVQSLARVVKAYTSSDGRGGTPNVASALNKLQQLGYALVITPGTRRDENGDQVNDCSRICLSFRATRRPGQLFSQPIFYTEVHFQGERIRR